MRSLEYLLRLQLPSGNFPSSAKKLQNDIRVQWCHGAPGAIPCLSVAYQIWGNRGLIDRAHKAAESVWKYGLLKRGRVGLCHGVAGNGYSFLTLYRLTGDEGYLR